MVHENPLAEKVVNHYGLMGSVKAALESSVRYLTAELGSKAIRVNALSPGPIRTRATCGLENIDQLISNAKHCAPIQPLTTIDEVGAFARFFVRDAARTITGSVMYIDGGHNIMSGVAHD